MEVKFHNPNQQISPHNPKKMIHWNLKDIHGQQLPEPHSSQVNSKYMYVSRMYRVLYVLYVVSFMIFMKTGSKALWENRGKRGGRLDE